VRAYESERRTTHQTERHRDTLTRKHELVLFVQVGATGAARVGLEVRVPGDDEIVPLPLIVRRDLEVWSERRPPSILHVPHEQLHVFCFVFLLQGFHDERHHIGNAVDNLSCLIVVVSRGDNKTPATPRHHDAGIGSDHVSSHFAEGIVGDAERVLTQEQGFVVEFSRL